MEWLNYHHLLYFWTVAREGGLVPAAHKLRLAHQTVSGQVHALEEALGEKLFVKEGRRLALTEVGRVVYRYADEIFSLGRELVDTVKDRPTGKPMRISVGVADVVPKLIARELLRPAQELPHGVRIVCREDKPDRLLAALTVHDLDVVLSDAPVPPHGPVRAFNHPLGECSVSFFAAPALASRFRRGFPRSLDGAPFLLPTENTSLRAALDPWFEKNGIRPHVIAECEDSALLTAFGEDSGAVFPASSVIARTIERQYGVRRLGTASELRERFFAITVERRLEHPAVRAISERARAQLFR